MGSPASLVPVVLHMGQRILRPRLAHMLMTSTRCDRAGCARLRWLGDKPLARPKRRLPETFRKPFALRHIASQRVVCAIDLSIRIEISSLSEVPEIHSAHFPTGSFFSNRNRLSKTRSLRYLREKMASTSRRRLQQFVQLHAVIGGAKCVAGSDGVFAHQLIEVVVQRA